MELLKGVCRLVDSLSGRMSEFTDNEEGRRAAQERAVTAWENDGEANPRGWKAVRRQDGTLVKIVPRGDFSTIEVNGREVYLDRDFSDAFSNLCATGAIPGTFLRVGPQVLDYDDPTDLLIFLRGIEIDESPGVVYSGDGPDPL